MPPRFTKPPAELAARFAAALPAGPLIESKRMFGYPAAFVHGNYFAGLVDEDVVIRLPDGLHERLPALKGAAGWNPMGRGGAMQSWFVVPPAVAREARKLAALLAAALPLVAALPPKVKKAKQAKQTLKAKKPSVPGTKAKATRPPAKAKAAKPRR
jgi:hypothetical protein